MSRVKTAVFKGSRESQMSRRQTSRAQSRGHRAVRDNLGLQFCTSLAPHSLSHTMRELARATHRLGYETSLFVPPQEIPRGWISTSIRHIRGICRPPLCFVSWGLPDLNLAPEGSPTVTFDVVDSYHWAMPNETSQYRLYTDLLCGPTMAGLQSYIDQGLECPTAVVPFGVDSSLYRPIESRDYSILDRVRWPRATPDLTEMKIVLVAGYIQSRKGLDVAISAFQKAFKPRDPVVLIVKNVASAWGKSVKSLVEASRGAWRIGVLETTLDEFEMARLIASADCLLSCHRREGFGLIPLQALACGTPVVATAFDGPLTYLTSTNSHLVEPDSVEVSTDENVPGRDLWAKLNPDSFVSSLRRVIVDEDLSTVESGLETAERMSWESAAGQLVDGIQRHLGEVRRRPVVEPSSVDLSILVPARNAMDDLRRLVQSLNTTQLSGEIDLDILDDQSTIPIDFDELQTFSPRVRVRGVRSDAWIGEGSARARLLRRARGRYVFMTDADVEFVDPLWAQTLIDGLPQMTVRHPQMTMPDGRIWSLGGCYKMYADRALPAWHVSMGEVGDPSRWDGEECPYIPGAGWFARRRDLLPLWDWTGGYFPTVFADVDMSFWARRHGISLELCSRAEVRHHHGSFTSSQTTSDEQSERFTTHADEFVRQWGEMIDDDLSRDAVCID